MTQIIKADLPHIYRLIEVLPGVIDGASSIKDIKRLGGLTNRSYHVILNSGKEYVARIPGEGTETLIRRSDEKNSTELACRLGVDAGLLYFGEDGTKLSEYIKDAVTMTAEAMRKPEVIKAIAEVLSVIHHSAIDTGIPFDVFEMAEQYETVIADLKVEMFKDYADIKKAVMQIKVWFDQEIKPELSPCHNDPLCANWVMGKDKLYLVDWEYAGMNDGMWDLAAVSIEAAYDSSCDRMLLDAYLGKNDPSATLHFLASKIFVDYLWTLWAKARVPYGGREMENWAQERYSRLKTFLREFEEAMPL